MLIFIVENRMASNYPDLKRIDDILDEIKAKNSCNRLIPPLRLVEQVMFCKRATQSMKKEAILSQVAVATKLRETAHKRSIAKICDELAFDTRDWIDTYVSRLPAKHKVESKMYEPGASRDIRLSTNPQIERVTEDAGNHTASSSVGTLPQKDVSLNLDSSEEAALLASDAESVTSTTKDTVLLKLASREKPSHDQTPSEPPKSSSSKQSTPPPSRKSPDSSRSSRPRKRAS